MEPAPDRPSLSNVHRELRSFPLHTIAPVAVVVLAAFALWRFLSSDPAIATAVALCTVPAVIGCVISYTQRRRMEVAGLLVCISNAAGCLLAVRVVGDDAMAWVYLALMANFFLASNRVATTTNLALTAALLAMPDVLLGSTPNIPGICVIAITLGFGYRFSGSLQGDRARLEQLASLDTLTGLPNRRTLERTLVQLIADDRSDRYGYALVILDIDHFKSVNDLYGHTSGDTALSDLAMILRFELREHDLAFRFGGEEFVILVNAKTREALESFAERIRKAVYQSLRGPGGRITISLGAAMYAGEPHWQDWFSRADAALYRVKENGRNSYMIAEELE